MIRKEDLIKHREAGSNQQHMLSEYYKGVRNMILPSGSNKLLEKKGHTLSEKLAAKNSNVEGRTEGMRQYSGKASKWPTSSVYTTRVLQVPKDRVKLVKGQEKKIGDKSDRLMECETPSNEIEKTNSSSCKNTKQKVELNEERKEKPSLANKFSHRRELQVNIHNFKEKNEIEDIAEKAITDIKYRIKTPAQKLNSNTETPKLMDEATINLKNKQLQEELGQIKEAINASESTQKKLAQEEANLKQVETRIRMETESNLYERVNPKRSIVVLKPYEKRSSFLFKTIDPIPSKKETSEENQKIELASSLEQLKRQQASMNTKQILIQDRLSLLSAEYKAKEEEISALNFEKARLSKALEDPLQAIDQMDVNFDEFQQHCKNSVKESPLSQKKENPPELFPETLSELQKSVDSKRSSLQSKRLDFRKQVSTILKNISENDRESVEASYRAESAISEAVRCEVKLQKLKEDLGNLEQSTTTNEMCRGILRKAGSVSRKSRKCYSEGDKKRKKSCNSKSSWISTGAKYGACVLSSAAVFFALGSCMQKGPGSKI